MKPILFNTEMVRAILDSRKTVTRRLVKPQPTEREQRPHKLPSGCFYFDIPSKRFPGTLDASVGPYWPPYQPGDIMYVRETWGYDKNNWIYKANYTAAELDRIACITRWHPSIHMPKDAARLFLRVKDVRAERLQDITDESAMEEGVRGFFLGMGESGYAVSADSKTFYEGPVGAFANLWNSTIKPADMETHGWRANPWVWVIEFERISREEKDCMAERRVLVDGLYRHFKGGIYRVMGVATHTETQERLVLYYDTQGTDNRTWARPYDEFMAKVDLEKYPDVMQEYRFELVEG